MRRLNLLGIIPILLTALAVTKRFWKWDFDDGFIVYRYVENILSGKGWVYNIGENYNASTSPLNTILTTLFAYFTGDVFVAAHLIGGVSLIGLGIFTYYILLRSAPVWFSSLFSSFIVFMMGNNFTWGLETNLSYAILASFICLDVYGKTSWLLLGFLVLARPDALLLVGLVTLREISINKKFPLKGLLLFSLPVIPWAIFSVWTFGNIFPATLSQKIWQGKSGFWGTWPVFFKGLLGFIKGDTVQHLAGTNWAPIVLVIPLVLSPQGLIQIIREKSWSVLILFLYIGAVLTAYTILNVPNYHWYYTGFLYGVYLASAYGILFIVQNFINKSGKFSNLLILTPSIFGLACFLYVVKTDFLDLRTDVYKRLSEKIKANLNTEDKVAAVEVGVVGYYLKNRIVDMVGLTTPYGEFITGKNNDKFFDEVRPEVIVMHNPLMPHEQAVFGDPRFTSRYYQEGVVTTTGYTELSFSKLGPERSFKGPIPMNLSNSNDVTISEGVFKVREGDPWLEFVLEKEIAKSEPLLVFEYDLSGGKIRDGLPVFARVYFAAEGQAFSESSAVPLVLMGGSNRSAVLSLTLPGSTKNNTVKIQRVRIDPIQDLPYMADSIFALRKASIAGF